MAEEHARARRDQSIRPTMLVLLVAGALSLPAAYVFERTEALGAEAASFILGTYPAPWSGAGLLAYVAAPVTATGAMILFLLPGLALCRWRAGGDLFRWIMQGFAVSLLYTSVIALGFTAAGAPQSEPLFVVALMLSGAGAVLYSARSRRGQELDRDAGDRGETGPDPLQDPATRTFLAGAAITVIGLSILFAPKIHWEHLNGDGLAVYEAARLLLQQVVPFWPPEAGDMAAFPGVTSFLFSLPGVVFLRMLGSLEGAARVPALLYLLPAAAGLLGVCRAGGARIATYQIAATWCGLALYLLVLAYSATYSPYTADLALPATQDTLLMVTVLGFVMAFLDDSPGWMVLFCVLSYAGLPNGPLLVALWAGAAMLFLRPIPWKQLAWTALALGVAFVGGYVVPIVVELLGGPRPGDEYVASSLLDRVRELVLFDVRRVLYWVVPCGIAPAAVFGFLRGHSRVGWAMMTVTLAYFGAFYLQPKTSLHYYVPCMLLPWIVFWSHERVIRSLDDGGMMRWALPACLVVALGLSWPLGYRLDRTALEVGENVLELIGGYEDSNPAVFAASDLLAAAIPMTWDPRVPEESFGGSPLVWVRYAERERSGRVPALVLIPASQSPPAGVRVLGSNAVATLYVEDEDAFARLPDLRPPALAGARIYRIPQSTLFR